MNLVLKPMSDYDLADVAALLNRGFADYFVKIEFSAATLLQMASQDGIRIPDSRVVLRGDEMVAAALMARRGWSSRGAGMAVIPSAQATGVGTWLVARLLEESRGRGERRMELEVIEQNSHGVRLYEKSGFRTLRRLVSFSLSGAEGDSGEELEEVDIRDVGRMVTAYGFPDLPWQVSGETVAHLGPPNLAYKMGCAYVVITDPSASTVAIRSAIVEPQRRGQGQAAKLLRALIARYPGKEWKVPALCPEEMGGLFESVGFVRDRLAQLHMVNEWS